MTNWIPRCSRCKCVVKPQKTLRIADYKRVRGAPPAIFVSRAWHCAVCLKDEFEERVALIMDGSRLPEPHALLETQRQFEKAFGNKVWHQETLSLS